MSVFTEYLNYQLLDVMKLTCRKTTNLNISKLNDFII